MTTKTSDARTDAQIPKKHHLDPRAAEIADNGKNGSPDDLLTTGQVSGWLAVSTQWLEIARHRGFGPKFIRLSTRRIRYRRADVLDWLTERSHRATSEYSRGA